MFTDVYNVSLTVSISPSPLLHPFLFRPPLTPTLRAPGRATCIALNPSDKTDMLVGVDTGEVLQLKTSSTHALTRYPAHTGAVRDVAWNAHHSKVFASCSLDWTLKIWIRDCL